MKLFSSAHTYMYMHKYAHRQEQPQRCKTTSSEVLVQSFTQGQRLALEQWMLQASPRHVYIYIYIYIYTCLN